MSAGIVEVLRSRALQEEDDSAFLFLDVDGEESARLTYAELGRQARRLAWCLRVREAGDEGDRVLLLFPPGLDFVVGFFACLTAGLVAVPSYPPRPNRAQPRLRAIAGDSRPRFVLTTAALLARRQELIAEIPELAAASWLATDGELPGLSDEWHGPAPAPDALAFLQYTSGSTSDPKGVRVRHGNLAHNEEMIRQAFGQSADSVVAGWLPLYHDMGLIGTVLQPLYVGARCLLMSPLAFLQRPRRWLEVISRYGVTTSGGPNFAYDLCVRRIGPDDRAGLDLSRWTVAFNGAETVRAETLQRFAEAFAPCGFRREAFYPCYGLAEATLFAAGGRPGVAPAVRAFQGADLERHRAVPAVAGEPGARALVSCGGPWLGQELAIVDPESHARLGPGEVGEIWLGGPSVAAGYWDKDEETARTFGAVPAAGGGPFLRTGDLGFVADGELFVTGRRKELIVLRGRNHYPQDLERTAERACPALRPGCGAAFAVDDGGDERLVLVYELERGRRIGPDGENTPAGMAAIAADLRTALAEEHELQLQDLVLVRAGTVPKTSSGKVQRYLCRQGYLSGRFLEPGTALGRSALATGEAGEPEDLVVDREALAALPAAQRPAALASWLARQVARLARVPAAGLDPALPLAAVGLDSLAAVELKNALETALGTSPDLPELLQGTVASLTAALTVRLAAPSAAQRERPPAAEETGHALSYGQRSLFFLHRMAPASAAYNLAFAARLHPPPGGPPDRPPLDRAAFAAALAELGERHAVLRTRYVETAAGPWAVIDAAPAVLLTELDAAAWTEEEVAVGLSALAEQPFDLERGPVLRAVLLARPEGPLLLLAAHHIALDLWSLVLLIDDLRLLYAAHAEAGTAPPAPASRATYAGWVAAQQAALAGPPGERLWEYWRGQLAGAAGEPPVLELPADRPRPPVQTFAGAVHRFPVTAELAAALSRLTREHGVTPYTVLLAAFKVWLHRATGQADLTVGSPLAGRSRPEDEAVAGFFVNVLPLRTVLPADPRFTELLARTRATVLGGLAHQDFPLALLVERLRPERDPGRSPFFGVAFVYERPHRLEELAGLVAGRAGARAALGGLELEALALERHFSQFDLTLNLMAGGAGLDAAFEFSTDLFDRTTVARWAGQLVTLFAGIAARPESRLAELPLLTAAERHQALLAWNDTVVPREPGETLHGLIAAQAKRTPDTVAVEHEAGFLTYREFQRRAGLLARHLASLGIAPGMLVGVAAERSLELMVGLLGVLQAGAAYVPLDPSYPADRLAFMIDDAQAPVLLTQERLRAALPATTSLPVCLDADWPAVSESAAAAGTLKAPLVPAGPDDLAYVIYTSGSTGRPKGAMVSHRAIVNRLRWMQEAYLLEGGDRVLQKTPVSFDVSVWELFWPLLTGACLVVARPGGHQDSDYLAELITVAEVTTLHFVPSMLEAFLAGSGLRGRTSLRRIVCSGEALPRELAERCLGRLEAGLHNLYGPTEAAVDVTFWACVADERERALPIGRPIANLRIHLAEAGFDPPTPTPIGVGGELLIGGAGLAVGYLGRPGLTAERFVPDPFAELAGTRLYRTGDLARRRPDGAIEFLGRLDHQVKVRGFRIEPGEIEAVLTSHPAVRAAVVVAAPDAAGRAARLVAYIVPAADEVPAAEPLRQFLRERLPEQAVPALFVTLPELPLSPSGKVDRRALPAVGTARPELESAFAPAGTPEEEVLAAIWAEVLGFDPVGGTVGIDDNFFALGGDSIRSLRVRTLAAERGLHFTLPQLFQHQTVRALAAAWGREERAEAGALPPLPPVTPFSLLAPEDRERLPDGLDDAYPLPQLQAGLVFHSEWSASYEVYLTSFHLRARWDREALERAAERVVDRHALLRSAFDLNHFSEPLALVHRAVAVPLQVDDLRALSPPEQEALLADWCLAARRRRFDWTRPPLLRLHVHLRSAETFQLTLTEPLLDGWSVASLMTELMATYQALLTAGPESPPPLPPPAAHYRDFVALERQAAAAAEVRDFWARQLAGFKVNALPRRSGRAKSDGAPVYRSLATVPPGVLSGLLAVARRVAVPVKSALLAAHLRVVGLLSGSDDIVTGVLFNGRPEVADGDRVLGTFLNALPFRAHLAGVSWAGLARAAFDTERALLPFRRYPMAQLQREHGGRPLFETGFNFTNFHVYHALSGLAGLEVLDAAASDQTYFPLTVQFNLDLAKPRLVVALDCDANELTADQAESALGFYLRALEAMAAAPQDDCREAALLSAAERQQLLVEWNDTAHELPEECVHQRFAALAAARPGALAASCGGEEWTYAELDRRSDRLARHLRRLGVGPEVRVGLCVERSLGLPLGVLAVLKAGGAYVPLDPDSPRERLAYMLADAAAPVLLTSSQLAVSLPPGAARRVLLDREADWEDAPAHGLAPGTGPLEGTSGEAGGLWRHLAYVIYTSGSTGLPKGVELEHRGLANLAAWHRRTYDLGERDRMLQVAGLAFDATVWEVWACLTAGASLYIPPEAVRLAPAGLARWMQERGITHGFLPTPLAEAVLLEPWPEGGALRSLLTGGDRLHRGPRPGLGFALFNHYGPTEGTVVSSQAPVAAGLAGLPPIGRPIANLRLYVVDRELRLVPAGAPGELLVGGIALARGYLSRPALTAEKFVPDPLGEEPGSRLYRTGDLVHHLPNGNVEFLGRIDQQVKIRGIRIELGEVEAALAAHPRVRECAVLARELVAAPDPAGHPAAPPEHQLVAWVVASEPSEPLETSELRAFLRECLPEVMVPSVFVSLDALPVTANGKLDRGALPAPESTVNIEHRFLAPRDPVEEDLATLWAQVLRRSRVGVHDDFFALGGHSLTATQLISRVRESFGVDVPMSALFEQPTVAALAETIEALRQEREGDDLTSWLEEIEQLTDDEVQRRLGVG